MTKDDYEYIENTLRELSMYIKHSKAKEPWCIEEQKKTHFRRLFYIVNDNVSPLEKKRIEEERIKFFEKYKNAPPGEKNFSMAPNEFSTAQERNFGEQSPPSIPPLRKEEDLKPNISKKEKGVSTLTEKEIEEMLLNIPGISITSKPRKDGRYQGYALVKGDRIYVYGRTRAEVASKLSMIVKGTYRKKKEITSFNGAPVNIDNFTKYYFEKFRKKKVAESTLYFDTCRYNNHIKPYFKNKSLKKISPGECQDLIDKLNGEGKHKTAEEVYSILSIIFKGAISHGILNKNPLSIVIKEKHERKHGTPLSAEEIRIFKESIKGKLVEPVLTLFLYTGIRPNELNSVRIDGPFIVALNSKRKNKKIEYKRIPIVPALEPFLDRIGPLSIHCVRKEFKEIFPNHKLYDLRTTFYSKCKELGVAEPALNHFAGHSSGVLADTYTFLSDEYLLEEGKKIRF